MESGSWHVDVRGRTRLCCLEYRGPRPSVVLLHGLAGYAEEWAGTVSWLSVRSRVGAVEQRGHGRSERFPADLTLEAFVADAEMWIERLGLAPAVVVGQSFGGLVALVLAARRPELVSGLVVVEASPSADPDAPEKVRRWLASWPVPFSSRQDAVSYFGGDTEWSRAWADGLEERGDGLWPAFEPEVLLASLAAASERSWWDEWAQIRCPTLVAYGELGGLRSETRRMVEELAGAQAIEVADAGHDLHLEQPLRWREALEAFLGALDR